MTKEEAIFTLSDIRSEYNCFSHIEGGRYHALSMGIEALKERKHGKWRRNMFGGELLSYSCSECGEHLPYKYNTDFCPSCGAQMELCENRNKVERTMYPSGKDGDDDV